MKENAKDSYDVEKIIRLIKGVIGWTVAVLFVVASWQFSWNSVLSSIPFFAASAILLSTIYFIENNNMLYQWLSSADDSVKPKKDEPTEDEQEQHVAFILGKIHKSTQQSRQIEEDKRYERDLAKAESDEAESEYSDEEDGDEPEITGRHVHFSKELKEVRLYDPRHAPNPSLSRPKRRTLPTLPLPKKMQTLPSLGAQVSSSENDLDYAFKNSASLAYLIAKMQQRNIDFLIQAVTESPDQRVDGSPYPHFRVNVMGQSLYYIVPIVFIQQLVSDGQLAETAISYKKDPFQAFAIQIKCSAVDGISAESLHNLYKILVDLFRDESDLTRTLSVAAYARDDQLWSSIPKPLLFNDQVSHTYSLPIRHSAPLLSSFRAFEHAMIRVTRDHNPLTFKEGVQVTTAFQSTREAPVQVARPKLSPQITCPAVQAICNQLKEDGYDFLVQTPSRKLLLKTPNGQSTFFELDIMTQEGYKVLPIAFVQQMVPEHRMREAMAKGHLTFITHVIQVKMKGDEKAFDRAMLLTLRIPFLEEQEALDAGRIPLVSGLKYYAQSLHAEWRQVDKEKLFNLQFRIDQAESPPYMRWPLLQSTKDFIVAIKRATDRHKTSIDDKHGMTKDVIKLTYF